MSVVSELSRLRRPKGTSRSTNPVTRGDNKAAIFFLAPWFIGLGLINIGAMIASAFLSFTDYSLLQAPKWIGLANYSRMLNDVQLHDSLRVTFTYVVVAVPIQLAVALGLALLLDRGVRGLALYRSVFYLRSEERRVGKECRSRW